MYGVSERRACGLLLLGRSTKRYEPVRRDDVALRMRLKELALSRPRFGCRRLTILLRREGWKVNHKRVYRLYRLEGLIVRIRRRKKLASLARTAPAIPTRENERWVMDFVSDALSDGRKFRVLTVVDAFTREWVALEAAHSLPAQRVAEALDRAIARRRQPGVIVSFRRACVDPRGGAQSVALGRCASFARVRARRSRWALGQASPGRSRAASPWAPRRARAGGAGAR